MFVVLLLFCMHFFLFFSFCFVYPMLLFDQLNTTSAMATNNRGNPLLVTDVNAEIRINVQSNEQIEPLEVTLFTFPFPKCIEPEAALNLQILANRLLVSTEPQHSSVNTTGMLIVSLERLIEVYGTTKGNQRGLCFTAAQLQIANALPAALKSSYGPYDYAVGNANGPARAAVGGAGVRAENVGNALAAAAVVDFAQLRNNLDNETKCREALSAVPFRELVTCLRLNESGASLR